MEQKKSAAKKPAATTKKKTDKPVAKAPVAKKDEKPSVEVVAEPIAEVAVENNEPETKIILIPNDPSLPDEYQVWEHNINGINIVIRRGVEEEVSADLYDAVTDKLKLQNIRFMGVEAFRNKSKLIAEI